MEFREKYWEIPYSEGIISKLQNFFDKNIFIGSISAPRVRI